MSAIDLQELISGILPFGSAPGPVAMLFAYFDESFAEGDPGHAVIAGFVGLPEAWGQVQSAWNAELERVGIQWFHYVECNGLRGQYKGWGREKRDAHLAVLSSIIADNDVIPVSAGFSGDWKKVISDFPPPMASRFPHAYNLCFELLMPDLIEQINHRWPSDRSVLIMADQQQFAARVVEIYSTFKFNGWWPEIFHLGFSDPRSVVPLQAADMMAFEVRRYLWNKDSSEFPLMARLLGRDPFNHRADVGMVLDEESAKIALSRPLAPLLPLPSQEASS